ncbi:hypothetical protein F5144DRAFT_574557, partial [Chaetomium tenue]
MSELAEQCFRGVRLPRRGLYGGRRLGVETILEVWGEGLRGAYLPFRLCLSVFLLMWVLWLVVARRCGDRVGVRWDEPRGKRATKKSKKTYNTGDSLVVTDPTTDPALTCLTRGERTGSRIF